MNDSNVSGNNELPETEGRFAAGNRAAVAAVARDAWALVNKSRIHENSDARIFGTIVSVITTIIGVVGAVKSLSGAVDDRAAALDPPLTVRINLRLQNLTPHILVVHSATFSTSRLWNSPTILSGETAEYPLTIGPGILIGGNTHQITFHLVDANRGISRIVTFDLGGANDVRVLSANIDGRFIPGPPTVDVRENRPMIYRHSGVVLYSTSVFGMVPSQTVNIDVSVLESPPVISPWSEKAEALPS
ncbi:hypothetical protein [Paraburkholderia nodosa]|uniref:hypothetical protein n=1 Tax=Paraburkholderia nodosa TaxID=392320 RepID=UPI0012B69487|nr:hypothetical protein [Paraburkholderia nodosa]